MQQATLRRESDGRVICERCGIAASMGARMRGLLGRSELSPDDGLLIATWSIHMFFMRFAIDAVFLDRDLVVRKVVADLKPWRVAFGRGSKSVLELPAGEAGRRGIHPGDRLELADGE